MIGDAKQAVIARPVTFAIVAFALTSLLLLGQFRIAGLL